MGRTSSRSAAARSPVARTSAAQEIDLSRYADVIDASRATGVLQAATRTFTKWDVATVRFLALNGAGTTLDVSRAPVNQTDVWSDDASSVLLSPGTRTVRVLMTGLRQRGPSNDSYVDDVRFHLVTSQVAREAYDRPCASPGQRHGRHR